MASCSSSTNGQSANQVRISLEDQLNRRKSFTFPKRTFGVKKAIYSSLQVLNEFASVKEERIRHLELFETNFVAIMYC